MTLTNFAILGFPIELSTNRAKANKLLIFTVFRTWKLKMEEKENNLVIKWPLWIL